MVSGVVVVDQTQVVNPKSHFLCQTQVGKEEGDILHADWDEDALSFLFSGLGLAASVYYSMGVFVLTNGLFQFDMFDSPRCRLRGQLDDSGWRCKLGCTRG